MPDYVTIKGLPELTRKIKSLEDLKQLVPALKAASSHLKGSVAKYPAQQHYTIKELGGWKSEKQRRWFFANLREGNIEVPYRRGQSPNSESLGRRWTIGQKNRGLTWTVGNNVSYGPYVQDKDRQAKIHKRIGWTTIQDVVDQEADTVLRFIKTKVDQILAM